MQINNLGGARMPVTTPANSTAQTARTSFGSLMQGASAPTAGSVSIPGASVVARTIAANSGSTPGSTLGSPYLQAQTGGTAAGTMSAADQKKAMVDLMKHSLMSFMSSTFSMGQNRPGIEPVED